MDKILVIGSNGQLGCELQQLASKYLQYEFIFTDRSTLDLIDPQLAEKITALGPNIIINCAAYTAVDKAESDFDRAHSINSEACRKLSHASNMCNAPLIHISSDYVYHIEKHGPIIEDDETHPRGIYAKTKLEGDNIIIAHCNKYLILRTSWVYSSYGSNFVKTMLRLADTKDELTIVSDQIGSPTYAKDIAETILHITTDLHKNKQFHNWGIYNFSNEGITSWLDFAKEIFLLTEKTMTLHGTTTTAYNAPAPRPLWSVLSKQKIKNVFGIEIRHWRDALRECLALLKL